MYSYFEASVSVESICFDQSKRLQINVVRTTLTYWLIRWWKQLGLVDKLSFARDRPLECFLWSVGLLPEPKYSICRIELAKTVAILLVIDDIFDTYGKMSDLLLFTDAIRRYFDMTNCLSFMVNSFNKVISIYHSIYPSIHPCVCFYLYRWDLEAMEALPEYMKICYMALYNTTNEICYKVLKENGWSVLPYLKSTVVHNKLNLVA